MLDTKALVKAHFEETYKLSFADMCWEGAHNVQAWGGGITVYYRVDSQGRPYDPMVD